MKAQGKYQMSILASILSVISIILISDIDADYYDDFIWPLLSV